MGYYDISIDEYKEIIERHNEELKAGIEEANKKTEELKIELEKTEKQNAEYKKQIAELEAKLKAANQ